MKKLLIVLAIGSLAASVTLGQAPRGKDAHTVGDLLLLLAAEMGFKLEKPMPELARTALATKGIRVEADLAAPLLEGDALAIFNQMGLHLSTLHPDRPVTAARLEMFLGLLRPPYTTRQVEPPPSVDDQDDGP